MDHCAVSQLNCVLKLGRLVQIPFLSANRATEQTMSNANTARIVQQLKTIAWICHGHGNSPLLDEHRVVPIALRPRVPGQTYNRDVAELYKRRVKKLILQDWSNMGNKPSSTADIPDEKLWAGLMNPEYMLSFLCCTKDPALEHDNGLDVFVISGGSLYGALNAHDQWFSMFSMHAMMLGIQSERLKWAYHGGSFAIPVAVESLQPSPRLRITTVKAPKTPTTQRAVFSGIFPTHFGFAPPDPRPLPLFGTKKATQGLPSLNKYQLPSPTIVKTRVVHPPTTITAAEALQWLSTLSVSNSDDDEL
jgi:hypothetical protein